MCKFQRSFVKLTIILFLGLRKTALYTSHKNDSQHLCTDPIFKMYIIFIVPDLKGSVTALGTPILTVIFFNLLFRQKFDSFYNFSNYPSLVSNYDLQLRKFNEICEITITTRMGKNKNSMIFLIISIFISVFRFIQLTLVRDVTRKFI